MSTIYLTKQNSSLLKQGATLVIKEGKDFSQHIPLFKVKQVLIFGNINVTTPALKTLLFRNIDTGFFTIRGKYLGRLTPSMPKNIILRHKQFERLSDEKTKLVISISIVKGKIINQRKILQRLNRSHSNIDLSNEVVKLRHLIGEIDKADGMEKVRGIEGRATNVYFNGFKKSFSEDWGFKKRKRRPPTDPINALLSLGYTLLLNHIYSTIEMVGLDPYFGSLHEIVYGRPSLALDIIEEFRPMIVDVLVSSVIGLKILTPDDFIREDVKNLDEEEIEKREDKDCSWEEEGEWQKEEKDKSEEKIELPVRLTDEGLRKFITQYERKMRTETFIEEKDRQFNYYQIIERQVRNFAKFIMGEKDCYEPYAIKG